jgi:hypothetical protein
LKIAIGRGSHVTLETSHPKTAGRPAGGSHSGALYLATM